jgi:DNA polymerase-3 subunit beta
VESCGIRFTCERDEIVRALGAVSGVVASKGIHPVYESVEIVATGGGLEILGTDLEIGMRVRVDAGDAVRIEEHGTAVVPAQRLNAICRELPKGPVTVAWNADARESAISAGRGRFRLQGQSPEDFPEIPQVDEANSVVLEPGTLRTLIRLTAFAAARERMRYALNGVLVRVEGGIVEFVATDGRRLARATAPVVSSGTAPFQAIVPTKGLQQLDKVLGEGDTEVRLAVANNHLCGRTSRVSVVSRLVEGSFPNYRDVIPATCAQKAIVPRESFAAALKRASLVTSRDAQSVKLRFAADGLTVLAHSADGSAEESVECDFHGSEETVGFNPEFLLEALSVLTGEGVQFEWNDRKSPGKVTEGGYVYVVMPVSLE